MTVSEPEHASAELGYDHPDFLDEESLERELRRVGEICHQCRRCLPLCPSFPRLFELIDATNGNHVWADHYDREIVDVFDIQVEIT